MKMELSLLEERANDVVIRGLKANETFMRTMVF